MIANDRSRTLGTRVLGGMLLTGIGVGLTLPTFMATGASSLPPHAFATGSGVINMLRQIGLAIGIAVLIAVLGTPHTGPQTLEVYQRASWVIAAIAFAGGLVALVLLTPRRTRAPAASSPAMPAAAGERA